MAKKETNNAKRDDMKALVGAALNKGWTQASLASFFGYSSFSAFTNGKSMGTNGLRNQLIGLVSFADSRAAVEARIVELEEMAIAAEVDLLKEQNKKVMTEEEFMAKNGEYARKYPETYTYANHVKQFNNNHWAINRARRRFDQVEKWLAALKKAAK